MGALPSLALLSKTTRVLVMWASGNRTLHRKHAIQRVYMKVAVSQKRKRDLGLRLDVRSGYLCVASSLINRWQTKAGHGKHPPGEV